MWDGMSVSLTGTYVGWECLDAVVGWWHQSEEHKNMNTFIRIHLLQIIFCYQAKHQAGTKTHFLAAYGTICRVRLRMLGGHCDKLRI